MKNIELPVSWSNLVAVVDGGVMALLLLLNQSNQSEVTLPKAGVELQASSTYMTLDKPAQLLLETTWNKGLAFFCWDVK